MDPNSRAMRIVRLAQQQASTSASTIPKEDCEHAFQTSTPMASPQQLGDSLDISYTELVPFIGMQNVNVDDQISVHSSFESYLNPTTSKGNILSHGNTIANCKFNSKFFNNREDDEEQNITAFPCPSQSREHNNQLRLNNEGCEEGSDALSIETLERTEATERIEVREVLEDTEMIEAPEIMEDPEGVEVPETMEVLEMIEAPEGVEAPKIIEAERIEVQERIEAPERMDAPGGAEGEIEIPQPSRREKRRRADESKWKKVVNKEKRAKGEAYVGRKYQTGTGKFELVEKQAKILGQRCGCKTSWTKCEDVSDTKREEIHREVWSFSWPQKQTMVKNLIHRIDVGRHRVAQSDASNRQNTLRYNLNIGSGLVPVCKKMFLNTTGLTQHFVRAQVLGETNDGVDKEPRASEGRSKIKDFLASLDTMPSHYCRKSTGKTYFERSFATKSDILKEYNEWCKERNITPSSRQLVYDEIDLGNYAVFKPRKDQCDLCVGHEAGNVDDEKYEVHINRKDQARAAKTSDKALAKACKDGSIKMITMDLQAVLLAPSLKASALYYRTKLSVHNFTIYDEGTQDVCCYVWHEGEGGLTANEFSSCVTDYIERNVPPQCKNLIIFSDGCPYQNRNATLAKALTFTAQTRSITITHKYLEKGHTNMEVDSVHQKIEERIKNQNIYSPSDYVRFIEAARQNPTPYSVRYVNNSFFSSFDNVCALKTIRPGKKKGEAQVVDIRCLEYRPDSTISYKLNYNDDWQELAVRGNSTIIQHQPVKLFKGPRKITAAKWRHLQELKSVVLPDLHAFYDNLPHD